VSLRFRYRMVHQTVAEYVQTALVDLGWVDAPVNFGTTRVTFLDFQPDEAGRVVAPNTVAVTLGNEPSSVDEELGGGLASIDFVVFVDVYGANQSVAVSIASDVKDVLEDAGMPVIDFILTQPSSERILVDKDSVVVEKPDAASGATDFRRYWRVVKATATVYYVPS
jgi:hypothetical protein